MSCKKIPVAICSTAVGASCFWPNVTMASPVPVAAATVAAEAVSKALPSSGDFSAEVRYANISGLPLASYGHFYDLETGLKYKPIPYFSLNAGYRRVDVHVHHGDDRGSFVLDGPWAGISYNF